MQPSAWNDSNQHWIPRFLLKGFGIKGQASKVYEMNVRTGRIRRRKVKDVASKTRLLTELDDELMRYIEVRSAQVIGRIRKRELDIQWKDRKVLDSLILAMMNNDPHSGIDEIKLRNDVVSNVSDELTRALYRHGGIADGGTIRKVVGDYLNHDYLNLVLSMEDSMALKALHFMGLRVHEAVEGENLILGDSP